MTLVPLNLLSPVVAVRQGLSSRGMYLQSFSDNRHPRLASSSNQADIPTAAAFCYTRMQQREVVFYHLKDGDSQWCIKGKSAHPDYTPVCVAKSSLITFCRSSAHRNMTLVLLANGPGYTRKSGARHLEQHISTSTSDNK